MEVDRFKFTRLENNYTLWCTCTELFVDFSIPDYDYWSMNDLFFLIKESNKFNVYKPRRSCYGEWKYANLIGSTPNEYSSLLEDIWKCSDGLVYLCRNGVFDIDRRRQNVYIFHPIEENLNERWLMKRLNRHPSKPAVYMTDEIPFNQVNMNFLKNPEMVLKLEKIANGRIENGRRR